MSSLGSVSGDTGSGHLQTGGMKPGWVKVRVTEDDEGIGGTSMRVRAVLQAAAGTDFSLFAYLNPGSDVQECSSSSIFSMNPAGQLEEVSLEWGETGWTANGKDDDRWVTFEVRYVSGDCLNAGMWKLDVYGNQ